MGLRDKFKLKYFFSAILTALIICTVTRNSVAFHTTQGNFYTPLTTAADTIKPRNAADSTSRLRFTGSDTIRPLRADTIPGLDSLDLGEDSLPAQ